MCTYMSLSKYVYTQVVYTLTPTQLCGHRAHLGGYNSNNKLINCFPTVLKSG